MKAISESIPLHSGTKAMLPISARIAAVGSLVCICATAIAAPYSTIQIPPVSAIASISNEEALHQLVLASLVAGNCEIPALTKGDSGLLSGTAQNVAENLGISTDQYFAAYVHPAMAEIASPDACSKYAEGTRIILEKVKELGGMVVDE